MTCDGGSWGWKAWGMFIQKEQHDGQRMPSRVHKEQVPGFPPPNWRILGPSLLLCCSGQCKDKSQSSGRWWVVALLASPSDDATRTRPSESVTPDNVSMCPFVDWHRCFFWMSLCFTELWWTSAPSPIKLTKSIHTLQGGSALAAKNSYR